MAVSWADIPGLFAGVGSVPRPWQQCWQQSGLGATPPMSYPRASIVMTLGPHARLQPLVCSEIRGPARHLSRSSSPPLDFTDLRSD